MIDPKKPLGTNYVLSESDREKFLLLWGEYAHKLPVPKNDRQAFPDHEEHQAPEVYVARIPPGGISALSVGANTGTGTGTPATSDDVPGSTLCPIYQLITDGGIRLISIGVSYQVYNLSIEPVKAGRWVLISRDKYGKWFITGTVGEEEGEEPSGTGTGTGTGTTFTPGCDGITIYQYACDTGSQHLIETATTYEICIDDMGNVTVNEV